ncbi:MAG: four helix bundle protein [Bacteroidia bacterium]|jgi:four helix bundle protein|nr:four helix bundle protein [Bacteroidia bacterium]
MSEIRTKLNKFDLEERLIRFAVAIVNLVSSMPDSRPASHLGGQLLRSGTSPALNYGEAQSGESRKDFIHKLQIVLKELRESHVCLKIIFSSQLYNSKEQMEVLLAESNELISIFVKSVETARKNDKQQVITS